MNHRGAKQLELFSKGARAYGGELRSTRKGRLGARALTTQGTIHLVLRSSKAKGAWAFNLSKNKAMIRQVLKNHAIKNYVQLLSVANVGNHIHLHIKLGHRIYYKRFIRAITGTIALKIMKAGPNAARVKSFGDRFWDYRPFTRIITSFRHFLNTQDYVAINQFEGLGMARLSARVIVAQNRAYYRAGTSMRQLSKTRAGTSMRQLSKTRAGHYLKLKCYK